MIIAKRCIYHKYQLALKRRRYRSSAYEMADIDMSIQIVIKQEDDDSKLKHGDLILEGILNYYPKQEQVKIDDDSKRKGIVVFDHGSGSGRHSPRKQYVASVLNDAGIATLLVDLLILEEQKIDDTKPEEQDPSEYKRLTVAGAMRLANQTAKEL
jgi:hypothetical protein